MALDLDQLRELLRAQEALLRDVGYGVRDLGDAEDEYRWRHGDLRRFLMSAGIPCYCPWDSLHAWPGRVTKFGGDVEAALRPLLTDGIRRLTGTVPDGPPWTLIPHPRWVPAFVALLSLEKQRVLDALLVGELAVRGLELLGNREKMESCRCQRGGSVYEYKIQRKTRNAEYKLRIFLETKPGNTLVLLHGFDKGANDSKAHQAAQIEVACDRRE